MTSIDVTHEQGALYRVTVSDEHGESTHHVTVTAADVTRYVAGATPEQLLEASFQFLLEREPRASILSRFELPVIERYFPDYAQVIHRYVWDAR